MSAIFQLPDNIRQELSLDESGKAYATQSGVARLCGISQQAINQLLEKIATSSYLSQNRSYLLLVWIIGLQANSMIC